MFDLLLEHCVTDAQAGRRGGRRGMAQEEKRLKQEEMLKAQDERMVALPSLQIWPLC